MTRNNLFAHFVGVLCIVAAFAWLVLDVRPDGHLEHDSALGVAILALIGGHLCDKERTAALVAWLVGAIKSLIPSGSVA